MQNSTPTATLQIKQISPTGEVLNVVTCPHARITVLRAHAPQDLEPYQRIFASVPGKERFTLYYNEELFDLSQATLIGYGEDYRKISGSIQEYLSQQGISETLSNSILHSFDLEDQAGMQFDQLTPCQAQRTRIVAAAYGKPRIIILKNPFQPLAFEWRERIAELLLRLAKKKKTLVLLTSLLHRPDCWIDNETILRVQVGQSTQRTIGFGSQASEYQELIEKLKQDLKQSSEAIVSAPEAPAAAQPLKQLNEFIKTLAPGLLTLRLQMAQRRKLWLSALGVLCLAMLVSISLLAKPDVVKEELARVTTPVSTRTTTKKHRTPHTVKAPESIAPKNIEVAPAAPLESIPALPAQDTTAQVKALEPHPVSPNIPAILIGYPVEIQKSILQAVYQPRIKNLPASSPAKFSEDTRGFLEDLRFASSNSTPAEGNHQPPPPAFIAPGGHNPDFSPESMLPGYKDMTLEERRQFLREQFKTAIDRATVPADAYREQP